ncbi:MAG: hypothetical protein ACQXXH_01685 [Candidatus Bathyarchaeia archaeon]|nr:hypothetical protein [Candidatus Bathyarchaeota archaeon A05DMB-4]MDH7564817.1 hypothetical protein [Candidatus Bathyarchaeota archaeon]
MTQDNKSQARKYPLPPIKLYQHVFCRNCDIHCNPAEARFQNCILTLIADELARTRQLQQHRTQHQNW